MPALIEDYDVTSDALTFWCQLLQLNLPEVSTYKFKPLFILMLEATSFDTVLLLAVQEVEEEDDPISFKRSLAIETQYRRVIDEWTDRWTPHDGKDRNMQSMVQVKKAKLHNSTLVNFPYSCPSETLDSCKSMRIYRKTELPLVTLAEGMHVSLCMMYTHTLF